MALRIKMPLFVFGIVLFGTSIALGEDIKHAFVCRDNGKKTVIMVDQINGTQWVNKVSNSRGLELVGDNRVLVSLTDGAMELDLATGDTLWHVAVSTGGSILSAHRLPNGNTMLSQNNKLTEVDSEGTIVNTIEHGYNDLRLVVRKPDGNWLLGRAGPKEIVEIDGEGEMVWKADLPGKGYQAIPMSNGNILATTGGTCSVVEIDPDKEIVWQAGKVNDENEDERLLWFSGFDTLANGNVVVANWNGHGHEGDGPHIVEIDRDNNVVWTWEDHVMAKTITNLIMIDGKDATDTKRRSDGHGHRTHGKELRVSINDGERNSITLLGRCVPVSGMGKMRSGSPFSMVFFEDPTGEWRMEMIAPR